MSVWHKWSYAIHSLSINPKVVCNLRSVWLKWSYTIHIMSIKTKVVSNVWSYLCYVPNL